MKGLKPGWAVKALVVALLLRCFSAAAAATNHSVGGAFGWDLSSDLQEWASQVTFHVGDSLVFRYTQLHEVLEVNATDYGICHTVNPLETYKDGETVIPLMEEGDRYFMCGRVGHCAMGLKLHVHVLPQLMVDSSATSSAPGPSPTASGSDKGSNRPSPPHATVRETFAILCLALCTVGAIVHPVYSSSSVLLHGMDQDRHRVSEYIIALLTSTTWLYYDVLRGHLWVILAFKLLTVTVEIFSLVVILIHVQTADRLIHCVYVLLFNISIPLNLLHTTSITMLGSCAVICNLLVFGWPVYRMKEVIRVQTCNADDISVGNSLICLLNGLLWILYSYLMGDAYIAIPNLVQVCVASAAIVLFETYKERASSLEEPLIGDSEA